MSSAAGLSGLSEILTSRASSTAGFVERSEGFRPNCGDRAYALRGHVCPGCMEWTHYHCMKKVPIGHSFNARTCSTCRGRLLETFELMQEDRDLDEAKAELDTIFERILVEYSHNGSVINDDAPLF